MSNNLLESLWTRVSANIGDRIDQISELLTQAFSASDESKAARDAAAASATEAAGHADRAELATDVTGLRNEVTQQIAELVDGSPEDLDTIREVAEYAQENRGVTDQLNAAIGGKADKSHTHTQSEITGLSTALDGKADKTHTHTQTQITGLSAALNGKANSSHTHTTAEITDTTTWINHADHPNKIPRTRADGYLHGGDPTEESHVAIKSYVDKEVAKKADSSHTHAQSDITGLSTALSGKANSSHKHTTADITDFATEMGKKANTSHTHTQAQVTGLSTALSGKADKTHTHAISDVTGLQAELDSKPTHNTMNSGLNGKANKTHTHTTSQVTGLDAALDGKADKSFVEARPAIFNIPSINDTLPAGARAGDVVITTDTWSFYVLTPAGG